MEINKRNWICIGLIIAFSVLAALTSVWWMLVSVAVTIYGVYYNFKDPSVAKEDVEVAQEPKAKDYGVDMDWESEVSSEDAYEYLLKVNYNLRVNTLSLTVEDASQIEGLIDDLRELIIMMEDSTSVLKWKVNQICVDFMPKLVSRFNVASTSGRREIMGTTVADIKNRVAEMRVLVETNNQAEFEHYANTLQQIMQK